MADTLAMSSWRSVDLCDIPRLLFASRAPLLPSPRGTVFDRPIQLQYGHGEYGLSNVGYSNYGNLGGLPEIHKKNGGDFL